MIKHLAPLTHHFLYVLWFFPPQPSLLQAMLFSKISFSWALTSNLFGGEIQPSGTGVLLGDAQSQAKANLDPRVGPPVAPRVGPRVDSRVRPRDRPQEQSAHDRNPRGLISPTEAPTKRPTKASTEVPRGSRFTCPIFHLFCSSASWGPGGSATQGKRGISLKDGQQ